MKKIFLAFILFAIVAGFGFTQTIPQVSDFMARNFSGLVQSYTPPSGSSPTDLSRFPRVRQWLMNHANADTEKYFYAVDLTQFPPTARENIMNRAFKRDGVLAEGTENQVLRVFWSDDNNTVHSEWSFTVGRGRWNGRWNTSGSSTIFQRYGEQARFHTFRFNWELLHLVEHLLRNDPMFAEIAEFAMQLSEEIEYEIRPAGGPIVRVDRQTGMRYMDCFGYVQEVMEKALGLNSVQSVQHWGAPGHHWNVLKLTDGRILYFDLTWFDAVGYNWKNITFYEELFRYSGLGTTETLYHTLGEFITERTK